MQQEPEELEKLKKEPEVLEKLIKLAGEGGVADNFTEGDEFPEERAGGARETEERAGGARETEERAGGARETGEIFRQSAEAKAEAEENAAVLEILKKKNGAFDEIADNSEENAAILERLQHSLERAELLIILLKKLEK